MPQTYLSPHNKIGYLFIALTALSLIGLLLGILSFFSGAQIILTSQTEEADVNFEAKISENLSNSASQENILTGQILESEREGEKKGIPKATVSMDDYAEGEIILTNNNSSALNFVAGTRFASPQNLIFRAVEPVRVPAKSKIIIKVKADKMGEEYNINPSQFSIPNLKDQNLKKNIVAESVNPMTGGVKKTGVVMQADIDNLKKILEEELYQGCLTEIKTKINQPNLKIAFLTNVVEEKIDAKANEEKTEFRVWEKLKIDAVAFDENSLLDLAIRFLKKNIPLGKKLIAYEPEGLSYRLKKCDLEKKEAILDVQFRGYMAIDASHPALDKNYFRGLSIDEVQDYFKEINEISSVKIKLWPPLILKRIPQNADKIKIKIIY